MTFLRMVASLNHPYKHLSLLLLLLALWELGMKHWLHRHLLLYWVFHLAALTFDKQAYFLKIYEKMYELITTSGLHLSLHYF